jgi:hypothetical protein
MTEEENVQQDIANSNVSINLGDLYKFSPKDLYLDLSTKHYANHTFIQVTERDLYLDFLEMPGVKQPDGRMAVSGARIYMTHASALSLAETLFSVLEKVEKEGHMESYTSMKAKRKTISTIISKSTKSTES